MLKFSIAAPVAARQSARSAFHALLDFVRLDRNVGHQVYRALFGDPHVVFQPDREAFLWNINSRLNRHHPACLQWLSSNSDIMDVQTQRMSDAVHEMFFECRLVGILLLYLCRR